MAFWDLSHRAICLTARGLVILASVSACGPAAPGAPAAPIEPGARPFAEAHVTTGPGEGDAPSRSLRLSDAPETGTAGVTSFVIDLGFDRAGRRFASGDPQVSARLCAADECHPASAWTLSVVTDADGRVTGHYRVEVASEIREGDFDARVEPHHGKSR